MPPRTQLLRSPGCRRGGTPSGRDYARLVVEKKIQVAPAFLEVLFALLARLLERAHGICLSCHRMCHGSVGGKQLVRHPLAPRACSRAPRACSTIAAGGGCGSACALRPARRRARQQEALRDAGRGRKGRGSGPATSGKSKGRKEANASLNSRHPSPASHTPKASRSHRFGDMMLTKVCWPHDRRPAHPNAL